MKKDNYSGFAEYYDYMLESIPERENFFKKIFSKNRVGKILDCACGTGKDLIYFNTLGYDVYGSDISDSMLKMAKEQFQKNGLDTQKLKKADFHNLKKYYTKEFDAIVCLSNSINEISVNPVKALSSMKSVLKDNGLIIIDQGQNDFSLKHPPLFAPIVNTRDFSRLFTMNYNKKVMTVNVFDFLHNDSKTDFRHNRHKIVIRFLNDWKEIIQKVNLKACYFGDWNFNAYNKRNAKRLIIVVGRNIKNII